MQNEGATTTATGAATGAHPGRIAGRAVPAGPASRRHRPNRARRLVGAWLLAILPCQAPAEELIELPFEQLVETDVVSAAQFARELTDAPSAVAVVTAEDIRIFGYRSLAEILDSMRGLHIGYDRIYYFPGGRGYGKPGEYAGRIALLIDGYPAADNIYNQIYLGDDGLLDTAVIERVEYAPGPGAAIYGNNAFLGVINVVTRRGRDFDGGRAAVTVGSHGDRQARLTWGRRFDNGGEWLLSASAHRLDPADPLPSTEQTSSHDQRLFLKGRQDGWRVEGAVARRTLRQRYLAAPPGGERAVDENAFWLVGHDAEHGAVRSSIKLYHGQYRYRDRTEESEEDAGLGFSGSTISIASTGRWWGVDAKLSGVLASGHRLVAGSEYRHDYEQRHRTSFRSEDFEDTIVDRGAARTVSLYLQDEIALRPDLDLNLGLRYDRRIHPGNTGRINPRVALLYRATPDTSIKLSHGIASRFSSWSDQTLQDRSRRPERVATTELVVDHRLPGLRLLASVYHYRQSDLITGAQDGGITRIDTNGAEIEAEWQWRSVLVRASHAWQYARDDLGRWQVNSPRQLAKLQVSAPLAGEALRTSLAARYVGQRLNSAREETGGYAIADLTLTSRSLLPGVELAAAVRNLFDRGYGDVAAGAGPDGLVPRDGRSFWLQAEYTFK